MVDSLEPNSEGNPQVVDGLPKEETTAQTDQIKPHLRPIDRWLTIFKTKLRRHLFTVVSVGVTGFLLWRVSQVSNIIFQFPEDPYQRWGFIGTLVLIAGCAVISVCGFLWPSIMEPKNKLTFRTVGWIALITLNWLNALAARLSILARGFLGYLLPILMAVAGAAWLMFLSTDTTIWQPWPLATGFARMLAVSVFWIGIWLFFGRWLNPKLMTASNVAAQQSQHFDDTRRRQRMAWQVSGRVLAYLTLTVIVGELLWIAAMWEFPLASLRLYSVWAIFEIASIGVMVCALIDYLDHKTLWPWRLTSVLAAFGVIWLTGPHRVDDAVSKAALAAAAANQASMSQTDESKFADSIDDALATDQSQKVDSFDDDKASNTQPVELHQWYADFETRLDAMSEGPAVFVAASGGGSRAALFTSMVLNMLHEEPMQIPVIDTGLVPAAPDPDAGLIDSDRDVESDGSTGASRSKGTWGDHIMAISCVSGGTLASARYVQLADSPLPKHDDPKNLKYTDFHELLQRCDDVFDSLIKQTTNNDPENRRELEALEKAKQQLATIAKRFPSPNHSAPLKGANPITEVQQPDPAIESVFRSKFIDEMCIDFMASILRGVLVPLEPRGQALYQFWNTQFDWKDITRATWRNHWDAKKQPMLLINATDIDHGRRMVIGYPSLPAELLPAAGVIEQIKFDDSVGSVRASEYSPYSLSSVDPNALNDITLGRAVRISSSFPFGFRPASIAVPNPSIDDPSRSKVLHFLDGGIVDNTGLDTFHALFQSLVREADRGDNHVATRLVGKLRKRGVILIEIDSGAKPSRKSPASDPFRVVSQPVGALGSANYTTALRTSDHYLTQIERLLTEDHTAFLARGVLQDSNVPKLSEFGRKQLSLISGSLPVLQQSPKDPTCKTDRLTCNSTNLDDQVMTAFALGPQGKARVIAQFLVQRDHWRGALKTMSQSYQQAIDARRDFGADSRSIELAFTRLVETSGRWVDLLEKDMSGNSPPASEEISARLGVPMALMIAAGKLAEDSDLQREIKRNKALEKMVTMVQSGHAEDLFAHFVPVELVANIGAPIGSSVPMSSVPKSAVPDDPGPQPKSANNKKQGDLWNNAVKQARQMSRKSTPIQSYKQTTLAAPKTDPFEQNKIQRQKSGRDFYQKK